MKIKLSNNYIEDKPGEVHNTCICWEGFPFYKRSDFSQGLLRPKLERLTGLQDYNLFFFIMLLYLLKYFMNSKIKLI